jgi:thioredoxin reductase
VVQVKKDDNRFVVTTDDNRQFRALSLIYCAGKEYLKLGVPGEEFFIGKDIGSVLHAMLPFNKTRLLQ